MGHGVKKDQSMIPAFLTGSKIPISIRVGRGHTALMKKASHDNTATTDPMECYNQAGSFRYCFHGRWY